MRFRAVSILRLGQNPRLKAPQAPLPSALSRLRPSICETGLRLRPQPNCAPSVRCPPFWRPLPAAFRNIEAAAFRMLHRSYSPFLCGQLCNGQQLLRRIIRKLDDIRESRAQAGVRREKLLHFFCIARQNNDKVFSVVLHPLDDGIDGFQSETVVRAAVQRICLIDEQHAAERRAMTCCVSGAV